MTLPPDVWNLIRSDFEQGLSQHSLARKYGVTQATISRHATTEQWRIIERITPVSMIQPDTLSEKPDSIIAIIATLLEKVVEHAQGDLDIKDIKLLADAMSQFHKIKLTSPEDKPSASGIAAELLPYFSTEQLNEWTELEKAQTAIIETVQAQKLEQEQNIKTIRRAM